MMRIPSGTTDQYIYFVAVDATDLSTRLTGLATWTVYLSRNGGAAAAMTTPTINETDATNMAGVYELLLDEDTTIAIGNDAEELVVHITHAGMHPVTRVVELYRPPASRYSLNTAQAGSGNTITLATAEPGTDNLFDGMVVLVREGTGKGQARIITNYNGTTRVATIAPNWATGANPDGTSIYEIVPGAAWTTLLDGSVITAASIATDAIQAAKIQDGALTSAKFFTVDGKALQSALQYIAAAVAGKLSGAGTGTETFQGLDKATNRLASSVDASGNRTDITYDP